MRLSRNILVKLTVVAALLFALYCLQTTNGLYWTTNTTENQNDNNNENHSTSLNLITNNIIDKSYSKASINNGSDYNVWCIFTKVTTNSPMRRKFRIFTESLLKFTSVEIAFHVITDNDSRKIAEGVIKGLISVLQKSIKVSNKY